MKQNYTHFFFEQSMLCTCASNYLLGICFKNSEEKNAAAWRYQHMVFSSITITLNT